MSYRAYLFITGAVFGIVAIIHLLRVVNSWMLMIGPRRITMDELVPDLPHYPALPKKTGTGLVAHVAE